MREIITPTDNFSSYSYLLTEWYREYARDLPWRQTKDPYIIWISEIILQQTRVNQGLDYFNRFVKRFPDVSTLAEADEDEVLKYWQGLGYYSRARNLHAAARQIEQLHEGKFPRMYDEILNLKGIGEYTAAAISSFAYNEPYAVLDGNVYRVLARLFGVETPVNAAGAKKEFQALAQLLLDKQQPDTHNQAIMEFGALQCVPVSPACHNCPLQDYCEAFHKNKVNSLPVKIKASKTKNRYFNYLFITNGGYTYLQKREGKDIWKNLYEFPLIETTEKNELDTLMKTDAFNNLFEGIKKVNLKDCCYSTKHILSHQIIYADFYMLDIDSENEGIKSLLKIKQDNLYDYPVSRLIELFLESKQIDK